MKEKGKSKKKKGRRNVLKKKEKKKKEGNSFLDVFSYFTTFRMIGIALVYWQKVLNEIRKKPKKNQKKNIFPLSMCLFSYFCFAFFLFLFFSFSFSFFLSFSFLCPSLYLSFFCTWRSWVLHHHRHGDIRGKPS